jgi:ribosomal-protein-alanine N-acetyltransferase
MENPIFLRAFEISDIELLNNWHNDHQINILTGGRKHFVSKEYDKKWLEDKMLNNVSQIYCAICCCENGKMIGYISLTGIDFVNRNAFWGGIIIGDTNARGKGYASKAAILLMNHAFFELGLLKVYGNWHAENKISISMARKIGFKQEGILRSHLFKNNVFHDVLVMSILKNEFEEKNKKLK